MTWTCETSKWKSVTKCNWCNEIEQIAREFNDQITSKEGEPTARNTHMTSKEGEQIGREVNIQNTSNEGELMARKF